jgi:hypothetical protein
VKLATPLIFLRCSSSCALVGLPTGFRYPSPLSVLASTNLLTMITSPFSSMRQVGINRRVIIGAGSV